MTALTKAILAFPLLFATTLFGGCTASINAKKKTPTAAARLKGTNGSFVVESPLWAHKRRATTPDESSSELEAASRRPHRKNMERGKISDTTPEAMGDAARKLERARAQAARAYSLVAELRSELQHFRQPAEDALTPIPSISSNPRYKHNFKEADRLEKAYLSYCKATTEQRRANRPYPTFEAHLLKKKVNPFDFDLKKIWEELRERLDAAETAYETLDEKHASALLAYNQTCGHLKQAGSRKPSSKKRPRKTSRPAAPEAASAKNPEISSDHDDIGPIPTTFDVDDAAKLRVAAV